MHGGGASASNSDDTAGHLAWLGGYQQASREWDGAADGRVRRNRPGGKGRKLDPKAEGVACAQVRRGRCVFLWRTATSGELLCRAPVLKWGQDGETPLERATCFLHSSLNLILKAVGTSRERMSPHRHCCPRAVTS